MVKNILKSFLVLLVSLFFFGCRVSTTIESTKEESVNETVDEETIETIESIAEESFTEESTEEMKDANFSITFLGNTYEIFIEKEEDYQILLSLIEAFDDLIETFDDSLSNFQKVLSLQGQMNLLRSINDICHNNKISEIEDLSIQKIKENEDRISFIKSNLSEYTSLPRPEDSYDYPEGTADMESYVLSCMIPDEVLDTMSTEALVQAIFEYPCPVIFVSGYKEMQVQLLKENCTAFKILETREDAKEKLEEKIGDIENVLLRMEENTPEYANTYMGYDLLNLALFSFDSNE